MSLETQIYAAAVRALQNRLEAEQKKAVRVYSEKEIDSGVVVGYSTMTPEAAMADRQCVVLASLIYEFQGMTVEENKT